MLIIMVLANCGWFAFPAGPGETTAAIIPNPVSDGERDVSAKFLEDTYGIKIIHIAVTAAGGLIDFRFRVLDPPKAAQVLHDPDRLPVLVVGKTGTALRASSETVHSIRMEKDAACFILYSNTRNAVKPGIPVSAVFGDVRIEPFTAQ